MARAKAESDGSNKRKSEVVTVRLDPRLKYLAEISARKQRRTLSGYIEWAVEQSLEQVMLRDSGRGLEPLTVSDAEKTYSLWDVDEAERLVRLSLAFPELLTFEEQLIWKLLKENGKIWLWYRDGMGGVYFKVAIESIIWDRVRQYWDVFKKVASGELTKDHLPAWERPDPANKSLPRDPDEEIPF